MSADNVRYQIHTQFEFKKFGKELAQFLESKNNVDHYTRLSGDWQSNDKTVGLRFIGGEEYPASTQIDKTIDVLSGEVYYHATPKAAGRFKTTAYLIDQQSRGHQCDEVESSQTESFGAEFHFYIPDSGQEAFSSIACKQESANALVCLLGVRGFYSKIDLARDFKIVRFSKQNAKFGFTEKLDQIMGDDLIRILQNGNHSNHQAEQAEIVKGYRQWKKPVRKLTKTKELLEVWEQSTPINPNEGSLLVGLWETTGGVEIKWQPPSQWVNLPIENNCDDFIAFNQDKNTGRISAYDEDKADAVTLKTNQVTTDRTYSAKATWLQFNRKGNKDGFRYAYRLGCRYSAIWDRLLCMQLSEMISEVSGKFISTGYEPYYFVVYKRSSNKTVIQNIEKQFGILLN